MPSKKKRTEESNATIVVVMGGFPRYEIERRHSMEFGEFVMETLREHGYKATRFILKNESHLRKLTCKREAIIFNALIGKFGEDGEFASFLERNKISFTGCGSIPSSILMDKARFKLLIRSHGIPTPAFQLINYKAWSKQKLKRHFGNQSPTTLTINLPVFIKANSAGFSVGATLVSDKTHFDDAIMAAGQVDNQVLIEEYIDGFDAHVPILNGSPLATIEKAPTVPTASEFASSQYNFRVRENYFLIPGGFTNRVGEKLKAYTRKAYDVLKLRGLCRADFRVTPAGKIFMLEMNAQHSIRKNRMALVAAAASGWQPIALIEEILKNRWIPPKQKVQQFQKHRD